MLAHQVSTTLAHQMALVQTHFDIAAQYGRPVSVHCVRAQGALLDTLASTPPERLPPRIMLHSFGGSPESVSQVRCGKAAMMGALHSHTGPGWPCAQWLHCIICAVYSTECAPLCVQCCWQLGMFENRF